MRNAKLPGSAGTRVGATYPVATKMDVELPDEVTAACPFHDLLISVCPEVSQSNKSLGSSISLALDVLASYSESEAVKICPFLGMHRVAGTRQAAEICKYYMVLHSEA